MSIWPSSRSVKADDGGLNLDGDGQPVEWLVKMRRLSDQKTLKHAIQRGQVRSEQLLALSETLARFFTHQAPAVVKTQEFQDTLTRHIEANRDDLLRLVASLARPIQYAYAAQMRYAKLFANLFHERVCDGRIVDGHGDLRPEHIYLEDQPTIIDCVEFNAQYRQNDIVDELGFLAMECDRLSAHNVANQIIQACLRATNDRPPESLIAFYKCYRACVRAKVVGLRMEQEQQLTGPNGRRDFETYLSLANENAQQLGPALIVTVGGLMGTGKSTLAKRLANETDAMLLTTDAIRSELHGSNRRLGYAEGKYSDFGRDEIYRTMLRRATDALEFSPTVVLDGTFSSQKKRRNVHDLAERLNAAYLHVECSCPRDVALRRIDARCREGNSVSEARPDLYVRQAADYEPVDEPHAIHVDTTHSLDHQMDRLLPMLRTLIDRAARPFAHPPAAATAKVAR